MTDYCKTKQPPAEMKLAFNLTEAASSIGVSVPTLYRLLESGQIVGRRFGRRWLIPVSAIETWLAGPGDDQGDE